MKKQKLLLNLKGILFLFLILNSCGPPRETESVETEEPVYGEADSVANDTAAYIPSFPDSAGIEEPVYVDSISYIPDSVDIEETVLVDIGS